VRVSGIADPFNGYIDGFCIALVQRADGCLGTFAENCPVYRSIR
jgi:hypothetical protein